MLEGCFSMCLHNWGCSLQQHKIDGCTSSRMTLLSHSYFVFVGCKNDPTEKGIIPKSFEQIFNHISRSSNVQYLVHSSYLEIYREEIRWANVRYLLILLLLPQVSICIVIYVRLLVLQCPKHILFEVYISWPTSITYFTLLYLSTIHTPLNKISSPFSKSTFKEILLFQWK